MFKLPFLAENQNFSKVCAVDINSKTVDTLILFKDDDDIRILGSGTAHLPKDCVRSGLILNKEKVKEALTLSIEDAHRDLEEHVDDVFLSISGDIVYEDVTLAKIERATPEQLINKKELKDFDNRIYEAAETQIRGQLFAKKGTDEEALLLETSTNVYIKINNEYIKSLENTSGKTVEIANYFLYLPDFFEANIKKVFKETKYKLRKIYSCGFSVTNALKNVNYVDYLVLELGSDFTHVSVIFGKTFVASRFLPLGFSHFLDELSLKMGVTTEEAEKLLFEYTQKKLSQTELDLVTDSIENILEIWTEGLKLLFLEFENIKTFPHKILMFGAGTDIPDVEDFLNSEPWTKGIAFKEPIEIKKLELNDIPNIHNSIGIQSHKWIKLATLGSFLESKI